MGTQGAKGVKEALFGSNTVKVLDSVNIPVWVIPKESKLWKFEETIFCSDYEDLNYPKTLGYYKDLISKNKASLKLLHIKTGESSKSVHKEHVKESEELRLFFNPEIEPKSRCVSSIDVEKGISWYIKRHPETDALAVVNHKRNFLANLFKENRTHKLAFHSNVPLLVLSDC